MTTFTLNTVRTAVLMAFCVLGSTTAMAAQATPAVLAKLAAHVGFPQASSKTLSFADLDLSTPEGVRTAHERLHQVARKLCSQVADDHDLSHHANFLACVDKAMAQALPKVEELARRNAPAPAIAQGISK